MTRGRSMMHIARDTIFSLLATFFSINLLPAQAFAGATTAPTLPHEVRVALERNAQELSNLRLDFVSQARPLIAEQGLANQMGCDVSSLRFWFAQRRQEVRLQGHLIRTRDLMQDHSTGDVIDD